MTFMLDSIGAISYYVCNIHLHNNSMREIPKKYPYAVIAVDVIIFTVEEGRLKVLLMRMGKKPYLDCWAAPGGLIAPDESLDAAARRVLYEKSGVNGIYLEQLSAFGEVNRDPFGRVVSVAYVALIPPRNFEETPSGNHPALVWYPVSRMPKLAYDHKEIVKSAIERLREKMSYTNIISRIMPDEFSLGDLQRLYEMIIGKKLDKRNFRRKILSLGLLRTLRKRRRGEAHRPAELYTFAVKRPIAVNILK